jgi:hypothetical protein
MTNKDWVAWHEPYDEAGSALHQRLAIVQSRIREALDAQPPGPVRVLSMCAGQGRDLIGAVTDHPRRDDVRARLVELDPSNAARAETDAYPGIEVVIGDAALTEAYEPVVPVDIALVCGVFGNISDEDIQYTLRQLPGLCRAGLVRRSSLRGSGFRRVAGVAVRRRHAPVRWRAAAVSPRCAPVRVPGMTRGPAAFPVLG